MALIGESKERGERLGLERYAAAVKADRQYAGDLTEAGIEEQCGEHWGSFTRITRKRPAGFINNIGRSDVATPSSCVDVSKLVSPKSVAAQIKKFEESIRQEQHLDHADDVVLTEEGDTTAGAQSGDGATEPTTTGGSFAYLTSATQKLIEKAREDRAALVNLMSQGQVDVKVMTPAGQIVNSKLLKGDGVIGTNGSIVSVLTACKVCQLRDFHSHDRGKRFHVYKLRSFGGNANPDHNIFWGTVLLVKWGDNRNVFAVVRVLSILVKEAGELREKYSTLLNPKDPDQCFRVELLDPVGGVRQSGGQEYRASGLQLPKLGAKMVLKIVQLLLMDAVAEEGQASHTALLQASDIHEMEDAGMRRTTASSGHIHVENLCEMEQDRDTGVMWNATKSGLTCTFCLSSMYDDSTGVLVKCCTCGDVYHQQCHTPVLATRSFQRDHWECAVCAGLDTEVCKCCNKNWSDPLKDNRLIMCEGGCGGWWHQKCHLPPVSHHDPDAPWVCEACEISEANKDAEDASGREGVVRRSARMASNKRKAGWTRGNYHGRNMGGAGGGNHSKGTWNRRGKHT